MAGVSTILWLDSLHPWGICFLSGGYDGKLHTWQLECSISDYKFWKPKLPYGKSEADVKIIGKSTFVQSLHIGKDSKDTTSIESPPLHG